MGILVFPGVGKNRGCPGFRAAKFVGVLVSAGFPEVRSLPSGSKIVGVLVFLDKNPPL